MEHGFWTSALFGYNKPLFIALFERLAIVLAALPWLMLLERAARPRASEPAGPEGSTETDSEAGGSSAAPFGWRGLLRTGVMLMWLDRVMLDFQLWTAGGAVAAGLWAAWGARSSDRQERRPSGGENARLWGWVHFNSPLVWLLLGFGAAALAMNLRQVALARGLAVAFILFGVYFGPKALNASKPDIAGLTIWLIASIMVVVSARGLVHERLFVLLAGGIAGWIGLKFSYWRQRNALPSPAGFRWQSGASALLAGLLIAVLAAEVYFRGIYDASDSNGSLRTSRRWSARHVKFNSWGYRDREFPEVPANIPYRVLVLGDSFAFGWGINDYDDLLGPQLERALAGRLPASPRVFTVAIGGINTTRQMELFRQDGTRLSPQVVVWAYHLNDIDPPDAHGPHPARWFLSLQAITDSSDFIQFLAWRVHERLARGHPGDPVTSSLSAYQDEAVFGRHAENIRTLLDDMRSAGAVPVVVLFPFLNGPTEAGPQRAALDRLGRLFSEQDVPTIDVTRLVNVNERRFHANPFDPHPSPALNREIVPHLAGPVTAALEAVDSPPASSKERPVLPQARADGDDPAPTGSPDTGDG